MPTIPPPPGADTEAAVLLDELNRALGEAGGPPAGETVTNYWRRRFRAVRYQLAQAQAAARAAAERSAEAERRLEELTERATQQWHTLRAEVCRHEADAAHWKRGYDHLAGVLREIEASRTRKLAHRAAGLAARVRRLVAPLRRPLAGRIR